MFFDEIQLICFFFCFVFLQLEKKASLQNKLAEVQQEHKRHIELVQSQHSKIVQDMQKDMAQQLAKLQEQLNKRESEKQQQLAQGRKKILYDTMSQSIPNVFFSL
jgi:predicted Holliday junction resolvase-like endonuclease